MNFKRISFIITLVVLFLLAVFFVLISHKPLSYVEIKGKKIKVEIADSQAEMEKGLIHRENLGENSGMLFIFPDSEIRSFWMKNTLISLDIIFVDENLEIVDIKNALPCSSEPCALYTSSLPAKYVLEVNSGFSEQNNLTIGEEVSLSI